MFQLAAHYTPITLLINSKGNGYGQVRLGTLPLEYISLKYTDDRL